jgi:hypothetical protein
MPHASHKPRWIEKASDAGPEAGDGDERQPPPSLGLGDGDCDGGAADGGRHRHLVTTEHGKERRSGPGEFATTEKAERSYHRSGDKDAVVVRHGGETMPARDVLE